MPHIQVFRETAASVPTNPRDRSGIKSTSLCLASTILACICLLSIGTGRSQSASALFNIDKRPAATITFGNSKLVRTATKLEQFVGINPGETVSVQLQFSPTLAGTPVIVQALDGGVISAADQNNAVGADGDASLRFRAGAKPGLYRIVANAGGITSAVQFWVADTENPSANPPTLKP